MSRSLVFRIQPRATQLGLEYLIRALEDIQRIVRDLDFAITRQATGRAWVVERLESSVPTVAVRPVSDGVTTLETFATGLQRLSEFARPEAPPPGFNEQVLEDIKATGRLFRGRLGVREIGVAADDDPVGVMRKDTVEKVDYLLRGGYRTLGTIEGMLERINWHNQRTFTIWDRVTGAAVNASFDPAHEEEILSLAKRRIAVTGSVRYFANGIPRSISAIEEIRPVAQRMEPPFADAGSIPDLTGGLDSVEFVKSRR
jgi:hypothetical protein